MAIVHGHIAQVAIVHDIVHGHIAQVAIVCTHRAALVTGLRCNIGYGCRMLDRARHWVQYSVLSGGSKQRS